MDIENFINLLATGQIWPAIAAALLVGTRVLRRLGLDKVVREHRLRPWIPVGLAFAAWAIAVASGAADTVVEGALQALLGLVTALAGHDIGQALVELLKAIGRSRGGSAGAATGALLLLLAMGPAPGCIAPQTRPVSFYTGQVAEDAAAAETRAECRRLRDRSWWTAAGAAAAGSLAAGMGGVRELDHGPRVELALGITGIAVAAVGAGLALMSTSYQGALDAHCSPWPAESAP